MPTPNLSNPPVSVVPPVSAPPSTTVTAPMNTYPPSSGTSTSFNYLALGDSYTIGQNVNEADRWPVQLTDMLISARINIGKPDIIAQTGWTTAELTMAIKNSGNKKKYSMVSLLIGVNNQYRGQSIEIYRKELAVLLTTAIGFAGNKPENVFMLSTPDWGATPYAQSTGRDVNQIAREIDMFNIVAEEECKKVNVAFIDITTVSKMAKYDLSYIASDGLHFSGKMHLLWCQKAYAKAKSIVN